MTHIIDVLASHKVDGTLRSYVPNAERSSLVNALAYVAVNRLAWTCWMKEDDEELIVSIRNKRTGRVLYRELIERTPGETSSYYERGIT